MKDPWKDMRKDLFGNIEPSVTLTAITTPTINVFPGPNYIPAESARLSYGHKIEEGASAKQYEQLTRSLIKLKHETPLEAVQYNFYIEGISKSCGAQLSRYRVGQGHVSTSRRHMKKNTPMRFVHPMFDYIEDRNKVFWMLNDSSDISSQQCAQYKRLLGDGWTKEDARRKTGIDYASARHWWVNARSLWHMFRERFKPDSEWEIRRLAMMVYEVVIEITPLLFEDMEVPW